jgi:Haem-binding domain
MKRFRKWGLAAAPLLALGASFVHPYGQIRHERSSGALLVEAEAPPEIARILERACQNCHSQRTEWPWYSYVAPMSWMIEKDVHGARTHMNLSRWQDYTVEQRLDLLTRLAVDVRNRKMPLPRYVTMHSEARLSNEDVEQLVSWAHRERTRVRSADAKGRTSTD